MPNTTELTRALSGAQIEQFIRDGFVKIENAFPRALADEGRAILWRDTGCDPGDPATWTKPVIRLGQYGQEPFAKSANTPILHKAFDQLVGKDRWWPRVSLGTFPVRFPSPDDPGDAGWHIDVSFGTDNPDFMEWRANITSKNRALLMLFSDVSDEDAPTRIRAGSHLDIAKMLAPSGENGLTLRELAANGRIAGGFGDGRCRDGLSLPSVSGACGSAASRPPPAFHGSASTPPRYSVVFESEWW